MTARGENDNELWDVYDKNRNLTGKKHRRGDLLNEGEYHLVYMYVSLIVKMNF